MIIVHGFLLFCIISTVLSLRVLEEKDLTSEQDLALRSLMNTLVEIASGRRSTGDSIKNAKELYKSMTKDMSKAQIKKWLRSQSLRSEINARAEESLRSDQTSIIEQELNSALHDQHSALLDKPFVEKQGKNDFLVMKKVRDDPFVTVIPNAIYYNIEKKCVNWLDDCSLQGIRSRLLHGAGGI